MALFRRNKTQETSTPTEVQDYYQAENHERTWVAWVLGFATLLVTVVVVTGLFFGGRWTYRKVSRQDKPATATNVAQETSPQTPESAPQTSGSSKISSSATPSSTNTSTSTAPASPAAKKATSNLPNTGPGDTFAIFTAVSATAYAVHRRYLATR